MVEIFPPDGIFGVLRKKIFTDPYWLDNIVANVSQQIIQQVLHIGSKCHVDVEIVLPNIGIYVPAKPLHNHDIASEHFNHFYCTEICDKLSRDFAMFIYIYLNVDEC